MGDSNNVGSASSSNNDMAAGTAAGPAAAAAENERTPSSVESTPEAEGPAAATAQDQTHPQKRKGGRKPIYATSEERKQRNRQAQAAFRERRTEYIKQLEANIKQNEDALGNLQQSHRSAADECLMLRYKNSLLERILLEKGVDVQAELQLKTGSSSLVPNFMPPAAPQPQQSQPPLQRTAINRQHARRSGQKYMPKLAPEQAPQPAYPATSPQQQGVPTPSSHASSPTNISMRSPVTVQQGGKAPPAATTHAQPQAQQYQGLPPRSQPPSHGAMYIPQQPYPPRQQRPNLPNPYQTSSASGVSSASPASQQSQHQSMSGTGPSSTGGGSQSASAFYPSPFQKHFDQLGKLTPCPKTSKKIFVRPIVDFMSTEHEYNTQASHPMMDDHEDHDYAPMDHTHTPYEPGYEAQYHGGHGYSRGSLQSEQQQMQHGQPAQQQHQNYRPPMPPQRQQTQKIEEAPSFDPGRQAIDPNDPMLDADPFGLSASMHFPTSYSFDHPPQR